MKSKEKTTIGALVVLGIFGALIYTASEEKIILEDIEEIAVLPEILPVAEAALPPLHNEPWEALIPDGIPLLEIEGVSVLTALDLPPLEGVE